MFVVKHPHIQSPETLKERERFARPTHMRLGDVNVERRLGAVVREQLRVVPNGHGSFVDTGRHVATVHYVDSLHRTGDRAELLLELATAGAEQLRGHDCKSRTTFLAALVDDVHALDALILQLAGVRSDLAELLAAEGVEVACEVDARSWREPAPPVIVAAPVVVEDEPEPVIEAPPPPEDWDSPEMAAQRAANAERRAQRHLRRHPTTPPEAA